MFDVQLGTIPEKSWEDGNPPPLRIVLDPQKDNNFKQLAALVQNTLREKTQKLTNMLVPTTSEEEVVSQAHLNNTPEGVMPGLTSAMAQQHPLREPGMTPNISPNAQPHSDAVVQRRRNSNQDDLINKQRPEVTFRNRHQPRCRPMPRPGRGGIKPHPKPQPTQRRRPLPTPLG